jgi:hypothetical protein
MFVRKQSPGCLLPVAMCMSYIQASVEFVIIIDLPNNKPSTTFFSVDSHERVFYYVDHSMSNIKKVDMITKIEQILYVGTVGAETISGMLFVACCYVYVIHTSICRVCYYNRFTK